MKLDSDIQQNSRVKYEEIFEWAFKESMVGLLEPKDNLLIQYG